MYKFSSLFLGLGPVVHEPGQAAWGPLEASQAGCTQHVTLTTLLMEELEVSESIMASMHNLLFQCISQRLCSYSVEGRKGSIAGLFSRQNDV